MNKNIYPDYKHVKWNPVLNFFIDVKTEYLNVFGTINCDYIDGYTDKSESCLERWIEELYDYSISTIVLDSLDYSIEVYNRQSKYQTWLNIIDPLEINQYNDFLLLRYGRYSNVYDGETESSGEDFWDRYNGFYRECRSIVIDIKNDRLVLTPFKKFFNVNELEETSIENVQKRINNASCIEFSDKIDGSMQSARWYNNQIVMAGSQALDPEKSWRLADGYKMINHPEYIQLLQDNPEYTFIFEYVSLKDSHVVKYTKEQEGLYLIGIRDELHGVEISYKNVLMTADAYGIPTTKIFDKTLDQVMSELDDKSSDEAEGFVLNIDGWKCKIKYNDYVHIHKALSKLSSINLIIRSIADDQYDDLLSKLPIAYHDDVKKIAKIVFDYIRQEEEIIQKYYDSIPEYLRNNKYDGNKYDSNNEDAKENKKEFMIYISKNIPKEYQAYCRSLYFGQKINVIKSGNDKCPHYKKLKDMGVKNYSSVFVDDS